MTLQVILSALALVVVVATALPIVRHDQWWIRVFDYPRWQIASVAAGVVLVGLIPAMRLGGFFRIVLILSGCCLVVQLATILPYTPIFSKQVLSGRNVESTSVIKLMIANVLQPNRTAKPLLAMIRQHDPDVILTIETDEWWARALSPIEADYKYVLKEPRDNTYGMILFSRFELINPRIEHLLENDIPSVHTEVRLPNGRSLMLHGLHPEPPYPKEATNTTKRDAELLIVGRLVKANARPAIVAGDLNDVAWSHTTALFRRVGGLLDPRIGRGMFNTFSAKNPILRWPLDHVFHTGHFKLIELKRLPPFGSDHFPIFVALSLDPTAPFEHDRPTADTEERELAKEKIDKAL